MRPRTGHAIAATTLALLAVTLLPGDGRAEFPKEKRIKTMPKVVYLLAASFEGENLVPIQSGSGTIITRDGVILTNHHVLWNQKAGRYADAVAVALLKAYDKNPEMTCIAVPQRALVRPELDLALLRCELDLQGRPYTPSNWPAIEAGTSEDLVPGDEVYVIGYPGIGGSTINLTSGKVSGFISARGGAGRDWIKTDAAIAHGNSGGTATDENGRIIGVPTARVLDQEENGASAGSMGLIRPVELARDLLAAAASGWKPSAPAQPAGDGAGGFGGPARKEEAPATGVTVVGKVVDSDNGNPIAGAFVIVFQPGVQVRDLTKDNLGEKFLTKAQTNHRGGFTMESPVPRGRSFAVMVAAEGYQVLMQDDVLKTDGEVSDPYDPWGVIRLARE